MINEANNNLGCNKLYINQKYKNINEIPKPINI